jgi:peptide/nickel transport system ATP-binding protein
MPLEFPIHQDAPLLEIQDLTVSFGEFTAVRDLSISVRRGETLALVGESGSGKSVTALTILRLLPRGGAISDGRIRFDGRDIATLCATELEELRGSAISMVFQEPMTSLNPVLTIGRQITEAIRRHEGVSARAARQRAIELLDLVRIPNAHHRVDEYPHSLSGGMRQRVMIAIAVACRPKLLIADEPTTALDVTIQAQVLELLDTLRRDLSMSLLLITHDLGIVGDWADRVVVMYAGQKCEEAPVEALFDTPIHPYTRGLIACSPRLDSDLHFRRSRLPEIAGSITSAAGVGGCAFAPRCPDAVSACWQNRPALVQTGRGGHFVACPVNLPAVMDDVLAVG